MSSLLVFTIIKSGIARLCNLSMTNTCMVYIAKHALHMIQASTLYIEDVSIRKHNID